MTREPIDEKEVFNSARRLAVLEERVAYLQQVCGHEPKALHRILELLNVYFQESSFLESPAASPCPTIDAPAATEVPGTMIGPYKLLEQIGEGGMGLVFMAEQTQPVRRRVALKIIKPGMDTRHVVARFEAERQALAIMDHPNIAHVFDAGTTDSGRPYFVMELVRGVPITEFCDQRRFTTRQRLELFVTVCQAVQHAHQKGIIHRDLKPSNVLVTLHDTVAVPKIIDFGIAKATTQPLTERTLFTNFAQMMGTPLYMSPEQAEMNGLDVDTRSDVYALGVLLYELLTGTTPFESPTLKKVGLDELRRMIREEEPPTPSQRLSTLAAQVCTTVSEQRGVDKRRQGQVLRGELDWIAMKALEKDRNRRYESASAFARDVQRYLNDEAVAACPPSAGYRLRKFLRRHRGPVLAAGLVLLALGGGIVGTTLGLVQAEQARQAEAKRAEGERLAKETAEKRLAQIEKGIDILGSIFENLDPQAEEKEGRPLRAILGERLDQAAAALEGEAVGDPLVVARLQDRLGRTYLGLGRAAEAETLFTRALATRKAELGADHPDTLGSMHNQALAYQAAEKLPQAIERFEQLRDAQVKKLGADHLDTLTTRNYLGVAYRLAQRSAEAVALLEQVGDARAKQLGADHPDTLTTLNCLALAYREAGKFPEAVALYEQVHDARVKRLGPEHPDTLTTLHHLALAYRAAGKFPEAIARFEQLRDAHVKRLGPDHPQTLTTLNNLAWTYRAAGNGTESIALYQQVREARMRKLEADQQDAFNTLIELAETYALVGNAEQALRLFQQAALAIEKRKFVHPNAGQVIDGLSCCHELLKQYAEAEVWRRKWLAVVKNQAGLESVAYTTALAALGANLLKQANYADAEPLLLRGYAGMKDREGELPPFERFSITEALEGLVELYDAWGKPAEAAKWRKELKKTKEKP
jgi:serine/threonine protein kinase/tetratricopeptide (TPR) repeat protein